MASSEPQQDQDPNFIDIEPKLYVGPERRRQIIMFPWSQIGYFIMGVGVIIALGIAAANYGQVSDQSEDNQKALSRISAINRSLQQEVDANCARNVAQDRAMRAFLDAITQTPAIKRAPDVKLAIEQSRALFDPEKIC